MDITLLARPVSWCNGDTLNVMLSGMRTLIEERLLVHSDGRPARLPPVFDSLRVEGAANAIRQDGTMMSS